MMFSPTAITKPYILLVEGKDDEFFFKALMKNLNLNNIQIFNYDGTPKFRDFLSGFIKTTGFADVSSLGITRDADTDYNDSFQSIHDALRAEHLPTPEHSLEPIDDGNGLKVTIMILPGNNMLGMLEDLCLKSVESDPAMPCVVQYFHCLKQKGSMPTNVSKAKVQAFLASRPKAGLLLGQAADKGYWPWENATFEDVKNFLQQIVS